MTFSAYWDHSQRWRNDVFHKYLLRHGLVFTISLLNLGSTPLFFLGLTTPIPSGKFTGHAPCTTGPRVLGGGEGKGRRRVWSRDGSVSIPWAQTAPDGLSIRQDELRVPARSRTNGRDQVRVTDRNARTCTSGPRPRASAWASWLGFPADLWQAAPASHGPHAGGVAQACSSTPRPRAPSHWPEPVTWPHP